MRPDGWFTLGVVVIMIVGLVRFEHLADVIFIGALTLLTLAGVVSPNDAVAGFKNEGMLTVGALFVVAGGLVETGLMGRIAHWILPRGSSSTAALRRAMPLSVSISAFMNNTTVVAMLMPALIEWSRKRGIAPSRLLLPLSYAAILGGVCTLIGTSTNLVIHGLMHQSTEPSLRGGLGMWELGKVGVPIAIVGTIYLIWIAPRLLPDRKEFLEQLGETRREYLAEIMVESNCPLIGQTVQDAGLRGLPGLFLIEIERAGDLISPVGPEERLRAGDRLIFTGVVGTLVDLQRTPGLVPASDTTFDFSPEGRSGRRLCEAVVSVSSPLIGKGIREANFRTIYDAAVVAVHRNGHRLRQKIGDIRLEPGDTLLLETGGGFFRAHRNNPDFYLVSEVGDTSSARHERAWVAGVIAAGMILVLTMPEILRLLMASPAMFGWMQIPAWLPEWFAERSVVFAMLAAGLMIVTRCLKASAARRSIEWSVLLVIAAAFGVGTAISKSGLAAFVAEHTTRYLFDLGPAGVLAGIYALTWILTELMSNNAAAALMFPIAVAAAHGVHASPRAFVVAVCIGASAGFCFPAGYQTHLMVFGPGGYRLSDFVKAGIPMVLIWGILAVVLIPRFWL